MSRFGKAEKAAWMREYMREYRRGVRRRKAKSTPPQPIKDTKGE